MKSNNLKFKLMFVLLSLNINHYFCELINFDIVKNIEKPAEIIEDKFETDIRIDTPIKPEDEANLKEFAINNSSQAWSMLDQLDAENNYGAKLALIKFCNFYVNDDFEPATFYTLHSSQEFITAYAIKLLNISPDSPPIIQNTFFSYQVIAPYYVKNVFKGYKALRNSFEGYKKFSFNSLRVYKDDIDLTIEKRIKLIKDLFELIDALHKNRYYNLPFNLGSFFLREKNGSNDPNDIHWSFFEAFNLKRDAYGYYNNPNRTIFSVNFDKDMGNGIGSVNAMTSRDYFNASVLIYIILLGNESKNLANSNEDLRVEKNKNEFVFSRFDKLIDEKLIIIKQESDLLANLYDDLAPKLKNMKDGNKNSFMEIRKSFDIFNRRLILI